ncbi:hypothetical protein [Flavobacterium wongokense]|uniref:hypothetical protein n=1 Tax=Flavobacterium wongokense TaxID=2910674 RepID=UPI001F484B73|nr:hypothetical protein [Flavobacterium sp. WG47]MCF6131612.1 hypothetical protein [Flavobacterium sp. WG47]
MKKILFFLTAVIALSCSNSDSGVTELTNLRLVTGVTFRQSFDDAPLRLGNPNTFVNDKFVMYPNPGNPDLYITSPQTITDVWLVKGKAERIYQQVELTGAFNSNTFTEATIDNNAASEISGNSSNDVSIDISNLPMGYYKVFVKIGGAIYWDNLYKYDDAHSNEEHIASVISFWQ